MALESGWRKAVERRDCGGGRGSLRGQSEAVVVKHVGMNHGMRRVRDFVRAAAEPRLDGGTSGESVRG